MARGSIKARPLLWSVVAILAVSAWVPARSDGGERETKAQKLAALRTQVNDLDARLRSERARAAAALRGLEGRKAELETTLDAAMVRVRALEDEVDELRKASLERSGTTGGLVSAVTRAISSLEEFVREGLPFQQEERLEALTRIRRELEKGGDPVSAAVSLWRFAQDERRMASTVEPAQVTLVLPGEDRPILSRTVRVGMIAMFVRTETNLWRISRGASGAKYEKIEDAEARAEVLRLFDSVDKRIDGGRYRLPLLTGDGEGR